MKYQALFFYCYATQNKCEMMNDEFQMIKDAASDVFYY